MTYGGEKATLDQQDGFDERNPTGLRFLISGKIRELRDKEDKIVHKIGYLQGHKEKGYQELSQVFGKYFPYYKFEAVDLAKGEKDVDETLDGLIMSTPDEEEIPTKELRRIDKFLMKGKALAVFANNLHLKDTDPTMNATFSGMGVDKLLSGYGIDFKTELLVDRQQFWTPVLMGPQGMGIQLPPYPLVLMADGGRPKTTFDNSFAPFFRLPQVAVPFPTEITIDGNRAGGASVKVTPVLKTSSRGSPPSQAPASRCTPARRARARPARSPRSARPSSASTWRARSRARSRVAARASTASPCRRPATRASSCCPRARSSRTRSRTRASRRWPA